MQSSSVRRQNSSCDQCRQSKRKCSLNSTPSGVAGKACVKCLRLGHECTFNFVAQQKRKSTTGTPGRNIRSTTINSVHNDLLSPDRSTSYNNATGAGTSIYSESAATSLQVASIIQNPETTTRLDGYPDDEASFDGFGHDNMMMNHIIAEWAHLTREDSAEEAPTPTNIINCQPTVSHPMSQSSLISKEQPNVVDRQDESTFPGLWKGSPIHLLNSSVASQLLNLSLGEVYNSMMSGITTRYLDYNCNLFAGPYKYTFESEDLAQAGPLAGDHIPMSTAHAAESIVNPRRNFFPPWRRSSYNFHPETLENHTLSPEQITTQINRVTMIGVARFLDNFGPLYGNPIERDARKQDEQTLTAVLQAFALQFAPSDPRRDPLKSKITSPQNSLFGSSVKNHPTNSAQVFTAAWHHAHLSLVNTKNHRSFVHIYAVFLFQMTVVPLECLMSRDASENPVNLLDVALSQMEELQQLVEIYCRDLKAESLYRFLLDSSLAIFRWYGIVRDSIASVLHGRPCFMDDPPFRIRGSAQRIAEDMTEQWQQPSTFEQHIARNCQNAAGDLFHIFRQLTHLKQFVLAMTTTTDYVVLLNRIESAISLSDGFNSIYQPWLEQCIVMFYRLSDRSKLSTAFLLLFWNLGHLCLVEQIHYVSHLLMPDLCGEMLSKADSLQEAAVTSVLAIARRIVDVSANGEFKLINSIQAKLQFVSHHANTALVVMALVKAVEHTIDLNLSRQAGTSRKLVTSTTSAQSGWVSSIKPLLTCLVALDSTISGAFTARPALQGLMQQYGDILMDCWSVEESEQPA